jgi:hypothetical protein
MVQAAPPQPVPTRTTRIDSNSDRADLFLTLYLSAPGSSAWS